jgi:hypothetical protein
VRPDTVGGSQAGDVSSSAVGLITFAEGSFPSVTGVTSANSYSVQLNTNRSQAGAGLCAQAGSSSSCQLWQQFVYSQSQQQAFIQYWLINATSCPSSQWKLVSATATTAGGCYMNSQMSPQVGSLSITDLANMSMTATAGGTDTLTFSSGGDTLYKASQASVLGLDTFWTTAEFNVFGDGGGSAVNFNNGASIVVQTLTDLATAGSPPGAPTCDPVSFTGETNNLTVVPSSCCPVRGGSPGIQFKESDVAGATPEACNLVAPRCEYSTSEELAGVPPMPTGSAIVSPLCTPDSADDPISIFKNVGGSWQSVGVLPASYQTAGFTMPEAGDAIVTFLACSGPSDPDTWPVAPGATGCDAVASNVTMPADEFYPSPSSITIPQNATGYVEMMIGGPWAQGFGSSHETFTVKTTMPGTAVATYSSGITAPGVQGETDLQISPSLTAPLGETFPLTVTGVDTLSGVSHTLTLSVTIAACQPVACIANQCGAVYSSNGCGGPAVNCGSCATGMICSNNMCCPTGQQWDAVTANCICESGTSWSSLQNKCISTCKTPACECIQAGGEWSGKYCE